MCYTTQVGKFMTVAISQKRGLPMFLLVCSFLERIVVTVFEALMLAIAFATLIVKISNKTTKINPS